MLHKQLVLSLTVTNLWANSADNKLVVFFLFSSETRILRFMQIVTIGDNLHEMLNPPFWEKYFKMSAEILPKY